jgi:hypothetical protein
VGDWQAIIGIYLYGLAVTAAALMPDATKADFWSIVVMSALWPILVPAVMLRGILGGGNHE